MKPEYINGQRLVERSELWKYEKPLYKVATDGTAVVVYYAGDSIPAWLQQQGGGDGSGD